MWSCMNLNTMKITQRLKKKTSELSYLADFENGFRLNSISRSDSKTTNARMKLSKTAFKNGQCLKIRVKKLLQKLTY